jgi:hypothetical protein
MIDKKSNESRRKLLKSIAAGGGAIIAGKSLPENWSRPVVDSVMLPAHALTSLEQYTSDPSNAALENDSLLADAMDSFIPEAAAAGKNGGDKLWEITCLTLNPDRSVKVDGLLTDGDDTVLVKAAAVWIGGDPVYMTIFGCTEIEEFDLSVRVTDISNGVARGYYLLDEEDKVNFYCPAGACSAPACPPD